jgi:hypothetical protein
VDDSQPGWVECWLTDADGREWAFVEKVPVVTTEPLDAQTHYPRRGFIACQVVERQAGGDGKGKVVIDTQEPWGVEATSGDTQFTIQPEQLVDVRCGGEERRDEP